MIQQVIIGAIALVVGAVIVYLIMRMRMASLIANEEGKKKEMEALKADNAALNQNLQSRQQQADALVAEKAALAKESEMKDEQLQALRNEVEKHKNDYIDQVKANGDMKSRCESVEKELSLLTASLNESNEKVRSQADDIKDLNQSATKQKELNAKVESERDTARKEVEMLNGQLSEHKAQMANMTDEMQKLAQKYEEQKDLTAKTESERDTARKEVALLKEQMQKEDQARAKALSAQLDMAKEQLQNATKDILKQREEQLGKTNNEQMANVVKPLKEQLEAMRKQVDDTIKTSAENTTTIKDAITSLMQRTQEISADANNLARALKNESKTQGNWGEMILETLLENSGLEEGKHYEKQGTLRDAQGRVVTHDETGKRMIPDVVVHYPDGKDCVIDSKVSLSDYLDYCNADTDEERERALLRHVASVKKHVKELYEKDYSSYIKAPRQSLGYTIMFIPNEVAMQIAMQADRNLWRQAFEKGVCITSEQNLLVLLRMIQMAWTQVQQAQNQQEVFDQARKLLDRVADFTERFEKIGEQVRKTGEAFDSARDKLFNGQQSVVKAANEMVKLGAKTSGKRQLPEPTEWRKGNDE